MSKAQQIIITSGALAVVLMAVLLILDALSFELYFTLCLLSFLIVVQMIGSSVARPRWRSRLNVVALVGVLAFFLVVTNKVLNILGIRPF